MYVGLIFTLGIGVCTSTKYLHSCTPTWPQHTQASRYNTTSTNIHMHCTDPLYMCICCTHLWWVLDVPSRTCCTFQPPAHSSDHGSNEICMYCTSICFCWNHKCSILGVDTEATSHPTITISTPHWRGPTRPKQLSVALPSLFVGWLGRWSLVAINRTSVPLARDQFVLTWSGLV